MIPGALPLPLYRGDTQSWTCTLWADDEESVPADLTGVVAKAEIRDRPGGSKITPLSCSIDGNVITVSLGAAESKTLPSKGAWDLQLTYDSGAVATVVAGPVTVTADITDSTEPAP